MARRFIVSRLLVLLASIGAVCAVPAIAQRLDQGGQGRPGGSGLPRATATRDGLMPNTDKQKLDALPSVSGLTLSAVYNNGTAAGSSQHLVMTNTKGDLVLDGTALTGFGGNILETAGPSGSYHLLAKNGDLSISGNFVGAALNGTTLTTSGNVVVGGTVTTTGAVYPAAGAWRDVYVGRGIQKTGLTTPTVAYSPFARCVTSTTCGDWAWTVSGSGANSAVTTVRGGVVQLTTGATAASQAAMWPASSGSGSLILRADQEKWYFAARARLTTTPDSQTWCAIGFLNVAQTRIIDVGVFGGDSTAKYSLRTGTGANPGTRQSAQSTVNIDTAWHTFEVWSASATATLSFSVDGETTVTLAASTLGTDGNYPWIECNNGTTAAAQTLQVDEVLYMAGIN